MNSSDSEVSLTPPDVLETAKITCSNLIPEISKDKYSNAYNMFNVWRKDKNVHSYSENVLLAYFTKLAKKYKASTLWTQYSMLRTMLNINNNVEIVKYAKLRAFLKRKSDGYRSKKSRIFTSEQIHNFIKEAPDNEYLLTKVVLIMGVMGACRRDELYKMKLNYFEDLGSAVLVKIPNTKTKISRTFTVTGYFYKIYKIYADLRPQNCKESCFFLNYQKGKCTVQRIGINKFGIMGKVIATYLKLPNPELYTGHCFRRSSATILIDSGESITSLKRHGGWKSTAVAEGYIDESLKNKYDTANKMLNSIQSSSNIPSRSKHTENITTELELEKENNLLKPALEPAATIETREWSETLKRPRNVELKSTITNNKHMNITAEKLHIITKTKLELIQKEKEYMEKEEKRRKHIYSVTIENLLQERKRQDEEHKVRMLILNCELKSKQQLHLGLSTS